MAKKAPPTPLPLRPREKSIIPIEARLRESTHPPRMWLWLGGLLALGVVILGVASFAAWGWLQNALSPINVHSTPIPITTLQVQRTASYAGLDFTIISAQYATSFAGDDIHSGQAIVRLNMHVANKSTDQVQVVYYDVARLLAPKVSPIAPTNTNLSIGPKPSASETGWLDFSVPQSLQLDTLKLQLGSTTLGESLVTIPFRGPFDPSRYANRSSHQTLTLYYTFQGHALTYHLLSVDILFSYQGSQCKAGQQFYVLNFRVDNPNSLDVSPGFGFDYLRLKINGYDQPPFGNTLPYTFKTGAKGVGGRVAFIGPAGRRTLTIAFRVQIGSAETDYDVTL